MKLQINTEKKKCLTFKKKHIFCQICDFVRYQKLAIAYFRTENHVTEKSMGMKMTHFFCNNLTYCIVVKTPSPFF